VSTPAPTGYAGQEPTHAPPWHGLVVWDVFFNALTTGLFLTASVGELAMPVAIAPVAAWAYPLALALLLADLTLLVLDLGDPLRFHHMLRVFKPSSPMSLGTWCLTLYSLPLTAVAALDLLTLSGVLPPESEAVWWARKVLLVLALPVAFGSMAYKGVLFSTSSQPGWRDARWLGAYHVASAFALGAATLLAVAALAGHAPAAALLRPGAAILLAVQAIPLALLAAELRPALAGAHTRGQLFFASAVAFGVGVALPVPLLLVGGTPAVVVAAGAALAGGWLVRHVVVALPQHLTHPASRHTPAS
jgi:hypothetical protein